MGYEQGILLMYLLSGIGMIMIAFAISFVLITTFSRGKSYNYRKYLTNLYVAGKIRKLSKKDDVDLSLEEIEFLKYEKFSNRQRIRDLDDRIEQEILEDTSKKDTKK